MSDSREPAFPNNLNGTMSDIGLTKREYFAGQALVGIMANSAILQFASMQKANLDTTLAKIATEHADALLTELAKPRGTTE